MLPPSNPEYPMLNLTISILQGLGFGLLIWSSSSHLWIIHPFLLLQNSLLSWWIPSGTWSNFFKLWVDIHSTWPMNDRDKECLNVCNSVLQSNETYDKINLTRIWWKLNHSLGCVEEKFILTLIKMAGRLQTIVIGVKTIAIRERDWP